MAWMLCGDLSPSGVSHQVEESVRHSGIRSLSDSKFGHQLMTCFDPRFHISWVADLLTPKVSPGMPWHGLPIAVPTRNPDFCVAFRIIKVEKRKEKKPPPEIN